MRIKLDFVITIPTTGDHTRTNIPWIDGTNINALIVDGLAKQIPTAIDVLPGASYEVTNLDFRAGMKEQRELRLAMAERRPKRVNRAGGATSPRKTSTKG
jgi:hypothetical protein